MFLQDGYIVMVQKYQETTYSLLYSKVGDTYGAGDGSTTFNLPDLQDEFIRGSSDTLAVGNKQDDDFKEQIQGTQLELIFMQSNRSSTEVVKLVCWKSWCQMIN